MNPEPKQDRSKAGTVFIILLLILGALGTLAFILGLSDGGR